VTLLAGNAIVPPFFFPAYAAPCAELHDSADCVGMRHLREPGGGAEAGGGDHGGGAILCIGASGAANGAGGPAPAMAGIGQILTARLATAQHSLQRKQPESLGCMDGKHCGVVRLQLPHKRVDN